MFNSATAHFFSFVTPRSLSFCLTYLQVGCFSYMTQMLSSPQLQLMVSTKIECFQTTTVHLRSLSLLTTSAASERSGECYQGTQRPKIHTRFPDALPVGAHSTFRSKRGATRTCNPKTLGCTEHDPRILWFMLKASRGTRSQSACLPPPHLHASV